MARHPEGNLTYLLSEDSVGEAEACVGEGREVLGGTAATVSCGPRLAFQRPKTRGVSESCKDLDPLVASSPDAMHIGRWVGWPGSSQV